MAGWISNKFGYANLFNFLSTYLQHGNISLEIPTIVSKQLND
jgi:hypothetical protein